MSRSPGPGGGRRRYIPDWPADLDARRRRLSRIMLLVAAVFVLAVFATPALLSRDDGASGTGFERRAGGWYLGDGAETTAVAVERIIDGDTLDVRLFGGESLRVRLFGASTPEVGERCADEATARLEALAGAEVLLLADERLEDAGGRALRYVFTPAGLSIDAVLIDDGLATAWREDGAYRDALLEVEDDARAAGDGCLWAGG